jgi:hypothetical protein
MKLSELIGLLLLPFMLSAQGYAPGWSGSAIIPDALFLNTTLWNLNQSDLGQGDSCYLTSDSTLHLHWKFGAGVRAKFTQCYLVLSSPVNLSGKDIIGIDIQGMQGKSWIRNVEIKFESGGAQAAYTWENLAHINRWAEKLVLLKDQFSNSQTFPWGNITVISFAITMNAADATDIQEDSGTVSFDNLVAESASGFTRADAWEPLTGLDEAELETIRVKAATALKNRQNNNGLLTTWLQDGSSWLYGQGLALRALTEEGEWNGTVAGNDFAAAATDLAHFLCAHQSGEGYWPRAWNAASGNIIVNLEGDNTVWMGDFPWIPGSLAYYYRKSGDESVLPAILKARSFLNQLVDPDGRTNTLNVQTRQHSEVSNYEGYAAVIYCLLELGDTIKARQVMDHVMQTGWNEELRCWKEGPASYRPVLLVNVWLAAIARNLGYPTEALDALSLAGKLLYTHGPGQPYGFDGVGPLATWYEGTLSYVAAAGPGSNTLFAGIKEHINPDGTVPAYNDNLGAMAGIWAVDWSSLDATSWLYFAAAQHTPFVYSGADPGLFSGFSGMQTGETAFDFIVAETRIYITDNQPANNEGYLLSLYTVHGMLAGKQYYPSDQQEIELSSLAGGGLQEGRIYLLVMTRGIRTLTKKIVYTGTAN